MDLHAASVFWNCIACQRRKLATCKSKGDPAMNVNILTQVIRQRRYSSSNPTKVRMQDESNNENFIYKDVAGFIIFLVVAFSFLMIAMFN